MTAKRPTLWQVTPHACHNCMGRVLERIDEYGQNVVRCAECGQMRNGTAEAICWCGVDVKVHGKVFECIENPAVSISVPQEILVRERKVVKERA